MTSSILKKPLIITFTPNPVLDLGGAVHKVIPDEKVYVESETRSPGGNGINAARILHRLGAPVTMSGFLGGGVGIELAALLKREGLSQNFIQIAEDTRIGITVSSMASHTQTRLSFRGPKIKPAEKQKLWRWFRKIPAESIVVIGGSLPHGFKPADVKKILRLGRERNFEVIVDCPGPILKDVLKSKPLLIKPNLLEFQEMTGSKGTTIQAVLGEARKLTRWVSWICVSSVEDGALLVTKDGAWFGRIPKVKINSVVGAGDSMVGAMTNYLWQNRKKAIDGGEMLRWGLAASCASLSHKGTDLGQAAEIKKFYKKTKVETLKDSTR